MSPWPIAIPALRNAMSTPPSSSLAGREGGVDLLGVAGVGVDEHRAERVGTARPCVVEVDDARRARPRP